MDQAADLRDITACLHQLAWVPDGYKQYMNWVGLGLTVVGLFPTIGSLAKGIIKAVFFKLPINQLIDTFNTFAKGHAPRYLKELQNGGLKVLCDKIIAKTREILDALYAKLHTLKNRLPDLLTGIKDKITAILHALDQCSNRLNAMFTRFFDDLASKLNRAIGQKFELSFEAATNSQVAYRQTQQQPPAYRVETSGKNGYIESRGRGTKTASKTAYQIAKEGGKHKGFFKQHKNLSRKELLKSQNKLNRRINEHENLIRKPKEFMEKLGKGDWDSLDPRQQKALVEKKWPSDIQRQKEQLNIVEGLLNE